MAGQSILILDSSVLVNFLAIDKATLLSRLKVPILITEHVEGEISQHYANQHQRLQTAINAGYIQKIAITDLVELAEFAKLSSSKPSKRKTLGAGECSSIAVAVNRGYDLAIDDKAAIKLVSANYPRIVIRRTHEIMIDLIKLGALTVEAADEIKAEWAARHNFVPPVRFSTFGELLP
jgi:predicted nucleic acid-binding protein